MLDVHGRQLSVKGLLDTGAVVRVMPVKTWTEMGFDRSDLIPTNIRLAAANQGAIHVTGRTPIISLQLGGRHLWMSFLVVEKLDESDQFILGRDFVRNFDVTIDLNDGLIRIKDPEMKYEKKPLNKILINQKLLTHSEPTVCKCVVEHRSNNSDNTEGKETWLRIASEHRPSECGELEKV